MAAVVGGGHPARVVGWVPVRCPGKLSTRSFGRPGRSSTCCEVPCVARGARGGGADPAGGARSGLSSWRHGWLRESSQAGCPRILRAGRVGFATLVVVASWLRRARPSPVAAKRVACGASSPFRRGRARCRDRARMAPLTPRTRGCRNLHRARVHLRSRRLLKWCSWLVRKRRVVPTWSPTQRPV